MKYFFLALSVIAIVASCNKPPKTNYMRESMLRKGKWKVTSGTLTLRKPNGLDTTLNYLNWIPYCHKDDYLVFDSLNVGYIFPGAITCNAGDADSIGFTWKLENGETTMSLYNGFSNTFGVAESILEPYFFDTLSTSPVVVDTFLSAVAGAAMTPPSPGLVDSFWKLHFDSAAIQRLDIYTASISSFSSSAFTINFAVISTYPDSTNHHTGGGIDADPIYRPDTFHYSVTYSNF
jgi:hypothetical protein